MANGTQTYVRDAVVKHFADLQTPGFLTGDEVAKALNHKEDVITQVLLSLFRKKILQRRKRGGTNRYEYHRGDRISFGLKHAGRKFPYHKLSSKQQEEKHPAPAASGMAGIVLKINGKAEAVTLSDAKSLFNDLKVLFG